jgi:glycosyltransferase involved in cell wall biosynthesis
MHILHINLAKGFRGGERQTSLLINGLSKQFPELQQTLMIRSGSPLPNFITNDGVKILSFRWPLIGCLFTSFKNIHLVHAHEAKACHIALLIFKIKKIPYLITRRMDRSPKINLFTKTIYKNVAQVACLSSAIEKIMQCYNRKSKTEIIPSMAASLEYKDETINEIKRHYNQQGKTILIGNVGALVKKHKGQHLIIEAARIIEHRHPQVHFLLVGDGYDKDELQEQALGLSNIDFVGFKSNVGDYLRAFDIFLFPSLQEGLGSTILDAMEAQLPIIATDAGGIPDLIKNNDTGILIEPESSQAIVDAIEKLINDKKLANQLAQNGNQKVKNYSPDAISKRYMESYRHILETHNL